MSIVTLSLSMFSYIVATTLLGGGGGGGQGGGMLESILLQALRFLDASLHKFNKHFKSKGVETFGVLHCRTRCS